MKTKRKNKKVKKGFFYRIGTGKERNYIVENLSTLISANVGVIEAFNSIEGELRSKYLREVIAEIKNDIKNGVPLWRALSGSGLFRASVISLIRIGEKTGRLSQNLLVVAERNRKNQSFRSKMQSAMMYPLFVLGLTVIIGTGIAWFILPKLATVFGQLKLELPLVTKIIIRIGEVLGTHGIIIVPVFLLSIALFVFFVFFFKKTKHVGEAILLRTPGIGRLMKEVETARFGYLLGTLLSAGIPVVEALESLQVSTPTRRYKKFYNYLRDTIAHGHPLSYAFAKYKKSKRIIPGPIQQMVVTGERSGNLSKMLLRVGQIYEEKIENTTKNVAVLLEPILLVIVWLGVMGIALAVILPIYGLLGGIR